MPLQPEIFLSPRVKPMQKSRQGGKTSNPGVCVGLVCAWSHLSKTMPKNDGMQVLC